MEPATRLLKVTAALLLLASALTSAAVDPLPSQGTSSGVRDKIPLSEDQDSGSGPPNGGADPALGRKLLASQGEPMGSQTWILVSAINGSSRSGGLGILYRDNCSALRLRCTRPRYRPMGLWLAPATSCLREATTKETYFAPVQGQWALKRSVFTTPSLGQACNPNLQIWAAASWSSPQPNRWATVAKLANLASTAGLTCMPRGLGTADAC